MNKGGGRTTGILGWAWRATVTPWGDVQPQDGSAALEWAIAADDRWHFPDRETSTRQVWIQGTPVAETRVRVPNGDVVQHVWSASLRDGASAVLVEFINDSPMPLAISLSRDDVVTPRAFHRLDAAQRPWPSEDRGIDRPALVIPLGHRARMRVALVRSGSIEPDDVDAFPDWETVARGWTSVADGASRIESPEVVDGVLVEDMVRSRRCELALDAPAAEHSDAVSSIHWMIAHRQLVRMGLSDVDVPEVVTSLEMLLRHIRRTCRTRTFDPFAVDALRCGALLLGGHDLRAHADFTRALERTVVKCGLAPAAGSGAAHILAMLPRPERSRVSDWQDPGFDLVSSIETDVVRWTGDDEVTLLPEGFDNFGLGVNFEAHRVPAGPSRDLSLAVRWHGARPALIWEVDGQPGLLLRSGADPEWTSVEPVGEALWNAPSPMTL